MDKKFTLKQIVNTDGSEKEYFSEVLVTIREKNDTYYQYEETLDEHALKVVMRIGTDEIRLQRRGIINMNFYFKVGVMTDTFYESPAGRHHFKIFTTHLETEDGDVLIHYDLYEADSKIGTYQYMLRKSEQHGS